jgi:hypothetical protein
MGGSMFSRSGVRTFRMPRVLGAAAALLLLGLVGTLSLAGSDDAADAGNAPAAATRPAPPKASPAPEPAAAAEPASSTPGAAGRDDAAKPPAASERRGPLSLPEAMARALAERKEKENARRDASGSKARPRGSSAYDALRAERNGTSTPDRATRSTSSPAARSGSRRDSMPAPIGPLENDL